MKYTILLLLLILNSLPAFGRIGLADWSAKTPHGNEINNYSDYSLYLKNGDQLDRLGEWYFYRDCVIGRLGEMGWIGDTLGYFVVHELTYTIDTFATKVAWEVFLEEQELRPKIWTRWYRTDWTLFNDVLFFFFFITIPLFCYYIWLLIQGLMREGLNWRKPYTRRWLMITIVVFLFWLIDRFPQSF